MSNWNGQGHPEVGEKVFINYSDFKVDDRIKEFEGKEVKVEAVFLCKGSTCLAVSHERYGIGAIVFGNEWVKPIKSDRDKAIEEMRNVFEYDVGDQKYILGALYDAGYRKTKSVAER